MIQQRTNALETKPQEGFFGEKKKENEEIYMLDICLLGTGGMMPLPYRWLTSMMARCKGSNLLIDCGEGTQIALKEKGWSPKPIDVICFTHYLSLIHI